MPGQVNLNIGTARADPGGAEGLKDGGHVLLSCSNCRAVLADLWRTRPHEPEVWKFQARCCWCGDKSFVAEVKGGVHYGGYGRIRADDEDVDTPSTVIDHYEFGDDDTFLLITAKASHDAKPIYRK